MKTAVIFADGVKQIVFTPENDDEKFALSLLTPSDDIELLIVDGSIYDPKKTPRPYTKTVNECRGGYLRIYEGEDSRILVLKPKNTNDTGDQSK